VIGTFFSDVCRAIREVKPETPDSDRRLARMNHEILFDRRSHIIAGTVAFSAATGRISDSLLGRFGRRGSSRFGRRIDLLTKVRRATGVA